jgi:hypothetical protein
VLSSAPEPKRPSRGPVPHYLTDEQLLHLIRQAEPDLSIQPSTDGTMWIAVEPPVPPRHRIYAGFSLLEIARRILDVHDL